MMEHTKLIDITKSVQIHFEPSKETTSIDDDQLLLEQYYEFEKLDGRVFIAGRCIRKQ